MKTAEFIAQVGVEAGLPVDVAETGVNAALAVITAALKHSDEVTLTGFGKFSVMQRDRRAGSNPRTGAPIDIPASRRPRFSAGARLRRAVQNGAAPSASRASGYREGAIVLSPVTNASSRSRTYKLARPTNSHDTAALVVVNTKPRSGRTQPSRGTVRH